MKKTLSVFMSVFIALALMVSAFANSIPEKKSVLNEINATVAYVTDGISDYTVDTAVDYYYISKGSTKAASFYDGFIQNVTENLTANNGKIVSLFGENITTYAAVIGVIDNMGGDPTNVGGYDLTKAFANADISSVSNPYHYNIVIPVAAKYCSEQMTASICDSFIKDYYVTGSGMNYWGFGCDNTAMFISAVVQSGLKAYDDVLSDALNILEKYKTDGGYFYNPEYGTEANINSTAFALMAKCNYCAVKGTASENVAELSEIYADLLTFKGETAGSYTYAGTESAYSAADALKGLCAYYEVLPEDDTAKDDNNGANQGAGDSESNKAENPVIPDTGNEFSVLPVAAIALCVIAGAGALSKKKER